MNKRSYLLIIIFAMIASSLITINVDLGKSSVTVGRIIDVTYQSFPIASSTITYGINESTKSKTYLGDLRSSFELGKCYVVSSEKHLFMVYHRILSLRETGFEERVFTVTGKGYRYRFRDIDFITRIHCGDYTLEFEGNYYDVFERGKTYRVTFLGNVLVSYSEIG